MPAPLNEIIKRRVVHQWLSGEARDKIASDLQIGAGTVSSIIANYKSGLEELEFDHVRELALEYNIKVQLISLGNDDYVGLFNSHLISGSLAKLVEEFSMSALSKHLRAVEEIL